MPRSLQVDDQHRARRGSRRCQLEAVALGFWDVGPSDNDGAADFAGDLDAATADARIEMVYRAKLVRWS